MILFDDTWEQLHSDREWGKYPSEELIRFIARNYYNKERNKIKILEIGCGQGANLWYMSREGFDTFGIDASKSAIDKAKKYLNKEELDSCLTVGNIDKIDYPDNYFNCVVDIQCLQCNMYQQIKKILKESYRLIKNGGKFFSICFSTDTHGFGTGDELENNTFINVDKTILSGNLHHFFTKEEIIQLYEEVGFKEITINSNTRTYNNDKLKIKSWIIEATK